VVNGMNLILLVRSYPGSGTTSQ